MNIPRIISITEARKNIFAIAEKTQTPGVHFTLTENGRARAVVMSADEFESWAETLNVLSEDPNIEKKVYMARAQAKRGRVVSLDSLKKKHGISSAARTKIRAGVR
ncbi:MAG: type II toxin-antitoxin system Phd/YefM family antitoxin [Patescibacteria group bacterium]